MNSSTPTTSNLAESVNRTEACRVVIFSIADHLLALPLAAVLKVVPRSTVLRTQAFEESPRLVYLEQQPITLINLHSVLSNTLESNQFSSSPEKSGQFLLIAGLHGYSQWAIPIDESPSLLELSLSCVHLLPDTYRRSIQNIACHVAVLDQEPPSSLLLLDLKQASRFS